MVDTIVMRVHNLNSKYKHVLTHLRNLSANRKNETVHYNSEIHLSEISNDYIYFGDSNKIHYSRFSNNLHIASSHYNLYYGANFERDYIEFNFSIPKYIYGTNLFQLVDKSEVDCFNVFEKLHNFLVEFFKTYFPLFIDYNDVEVNRLDFCFNQFFKSKEEALKYLASQKELNIKHARSDKNRFNDYGSTTIQYITANYTFKIYHKGTEFAKNDFKELAKAYNRNKKGYKYDLIELQKIADKILRYEITFRKGGLNYVYKSKVIDDPGTVVNRELKRIIKIRTKAVKNFLNDFQNKSFSFRLASIFDKPNITTEDIVNNRNYTLCYDFFLSLWNFFYERIENYQLKRFLTLTDIYEKLKESDKKTKILKGSANNTSQLLLICALSQFMDISDLKDIIPKSTYYRYIGKLKDAEIPINQIEDVEPYDLDFSRYFFELGKYHTIYN